MGSSCGVSPAEFDWNNSGLTNPLEENGKLNSLISDAFISQMNINNSTQICLSDLSMFVTIAHSRICNGFKSK